MGGMAFLPEEFSGAEEQACAHFPAHYIGPLVDEDRQVAVAADPVLIRVPDNGFAGWAHHQLFFQFGIGIGHQPARPVGIGFEAVMRYHGAFLGKTFGVLFFFFKEALGNEQREIGVAVARFLEHLVKLCLHFLPNGVTIGFDDHTALYGAVFCQVGLFHQVVIPFGVVLAALYLLEAHLWNVFCRFTCAKVAETLHCERRNPP